MTPSTARRATACAADRAVRDADVLDTLRTQGPLTVRGICEDTGRATADVQRALQSLRVGGAVGVVGSQTCRTKPANVWAPT